MKKLPQNQLIEILKNRTPEYDLDKIAKQAGFDDFFDYTEDEALSEFDGKTIHGGKRPGAGRPAGTKKQDKKISYATKLPPYLVDWLRNQERPAAQLIEQALIETFKIQK